MFTIEMLPAREGDCLLITYGDEAHPRRVLIDGGRAATYDDLKAHLATMGTTSSDFELLIVTHIDRDHIEGVLELVEDPDPPIRFGDIWFNGYHHLLAKSIESFGPVQGERLSERLGAMSREGGPNWNGAFEGGPVVLGESESVQVALPGDMTLTLLSPSRTELLRLAPTWQKECEKAGIIAGQAATPDPPGIESFGPIDIEALAEEPFEEDGSRANGSSIAVIAEHDGRRALLAGDAHPTLLRESLVTLFPDEDRVRFDAFKVPHHGSQKSLSNELLAKIRCPRFLVSTNGSYFKHPDRVAISRLIRHGGPGAELWFNYRSDETVVWDVAEWKTEHEYTVHYPAKDGHQRVDLA